MSEQRLHPEQIKRGVVTLRRWVDFFDPSAYENLLNQLAPDTQYAQPAPPQIASDVIERMCAAYNDRGCCPESEAMQAAARVLADALCNELQRTLDAQTTLSTDHKTAICNTVRARIEPKTPEDRVTIRPMEVNAGWRVDVDGAFQIGGEWLSEGHARVFAEGLRARLAKEENV